MIYQIQAQVAADAKEQQTLEQQLNPQILSRQKNNLVAFAQHIPSIFEQFKSYVPQRFGYFVTAAGQVNLVDLTTGITFYSQHAERDAKRDAETFVRQATKFEIATGATEQRALPKKLAKGEALMVFGLGSGVALEQVLSEHQFDAVVVYEPEEDVFAASLGCCDWAAILYKAEATQTQLFLQIGEAAMSPADDLTELAEHLQLQNLWLYRHTHHNFLDAWHAYLVSDEYDLTNVKKRNYKLKNFSGIEHQLPFYSPQPASDLASYYQSADQGVLIAPPSLKSQAEALFEQNWTALAEFYPDLHKQLEDYQPRCWQLIGNDKGELNLYHRYRKGYWYPESPQQLSIESMRDYQRHAQANDLAISYTGGKLAKYEHFKYSRRLGEILAEHGKRKEVLPGSIPAMAIFMPALGYQLELLLSEHTIHSLYVVEPNIDFFYLSLYTVEWHQFFANFKEREGSLYFSIGDDGSYLEQDMIKRFSEGDGYLTANTYFYLPTPVAQLKAAVNNLRREMKSLLVWAEYFDHVRYALAHNRLNFLNNVRLLDGEAIKRFKAKTQPINTPVFIVGNGPSLDESIEHLRSIRDHVLVMSCGTALKALYSYGIVPDFHVELEQNRVPFDIITAIEDASYLQQITLLTITTVHPDVAALFKETWTAFKYGDGSTVAYQSAAIELAIELATVHYAFPTVSNLALNFALLYGFRQIYLMGVDLGYVSLEKHHSKHSVYYNNKQKSELYTYKNGVTGHTRVKGNLQPLVETQFQFKASADLMSQLLKEMPHQEVYNCSNGMFINGTIPLQPEHIILETGLTSPSKSYTYIRESLHSTKLASQLQYAFDQRFESNQLVHELRLLLSTLNSPITDEVSALKLLKEQQGIISLSFRASKSLLFPLMASELHLTHATLIRFLYAGQDSDHGLELFKLGLAEWERTTEKIMADYLFEPMRCDSTEWSQKPKL